MPFYITIEKRLQSGTTQVAWETRWFDGRGRTVKDVLPKDVTNSIVVDTTYTNTGVISTTTMPYLVPYAGQTGTPTPAPGTYPMTRGTDQEGLTCS